MCAYAGGFVVYVKLVGATDFNYDRYLTASVVFGVILAGRLLGNLVSHARSPKVLLPVAAVGAVCIASFGLPVESLLAQPVLAVPQAGLVHFLEAQGFTQGIGDYWSSSIVTVVSDGAVAVRPVIADPKGVVVRYDRQSDQAWYNGQSFQFLVYDTATPFGVDWALAARTFGRPKSTYVIGDYTVLIFRQPVSVSPLGGYDPG